MIGIAIRNIFPLSKDYFVQKKVGPQRDQNWVLNLYDYDVIQINSCSQVREDYFYSHPQYDVLRPPVKKDFEVEQLNFPVSRYYECYSIISKIHNS